MYIMDTDHTIPLPISVILFTLLFGDSTSVSKKRTNQQNRETFPICSWKKQTSND